MSVVEALTEEEVLSLQPTFGRATARHAARVVAEALTRGLTLLGALEEAWGRLRVHRRALGDDVVGAERERLARAVAREEGVVACALWAAHHGPAVTAASRVRLASSARAIAGDGSWRLVRAAFDVLGELADAGTLDAPAVDQAWAWAGNLEAPVWSQVAAWSFLVRASVPAGEIALPLASRVIAMGAVDDFFVRAAVARLLGRCRPDIATAALEKAAADPSEHVRMAVCEALGSLGARAALVRLANPAVELSPRVRATAAIALAPIAPLDLESILLMDPDEVPRRIALEEAEPRATEHRALASAIERLSAQAPWPALRVLAADAAERLHHARDARASETLLGLSETMATVPVHGSRVVSTPASRAELGRAMAVLSARDHALAADVVDAGRYRITKGEPRERRVWRALHELFHPAPDKRQSHTHTLGRAMRGVLRSPTSVLAEVSATRVPGERVHAPPVGGWARHLPAVDDLLDRPKRGELHIFSSDGVTVLRFPSPSDWMLVRARVVVGYAQLARVRAQSLHGTDAHERGAFSRALAALGFELSFRAYRDVHAPEVVDLFVDLFVGVPQKPQAAGLGLFVPLAAPGATSWVEQLGHFLRPDLSAAHSANQVAAIGVVALGVMAARLYEARRELDAARATIPLSVGGWGTRGKSGTERLKAALFQGLGCEVLAKTTGCEAMFLHCIPGLRAEEVFLYRTYDKATIWEQRDTLRLASRLGVDVFLWECMALNPEYVDILQRQWMRDDLATLTNAYPDHENIQGPTGLDVAEVMTRFIPTGRTLITAEEEMLPVLRDAATARRSRLLNVRWRDHALLAEDLLARFPYDEHPRNIALVVELARDLGVDRAIACKEMADWLVPDLGVLKTYPEVAWRNSRLEFSNGMSANERTGFMSNWSRAGFDGHHPDAAACLGEWIVTLVNNRADRLSRSAVFADIVTNDAAAHRHVLIGTNVRGLARQITRSVDVMLRKAVLLGREEQALSFDERWARVDERSTRLLERLKLGEVGPARLVAEADALSARLLDGRVGLVDANAFDAVTAVQASGLQGARAALGDELTARLAGFATALGSEGGAALGHLTDLATKHAVVLRWRQEAQALLHADVAGSRERLHRAFATVYREIAQEQVVSLENPTLTGDQIIDAVARLAPPGFRVRIMGAQNIKGTGLDFAYRWIGLDRSVRAVRALDGATAAGAVELARELLARDDLGILDFAVAAPAFARAAERAGDGGDSAWPGLLERLRGGAESAEGRLAQPEGAPSSGRLLERILDVWDGVSRRRRSERIIDQLVSGAISHATAARQMRGLVARQKGGWLFASPRRRA